MHAFINHPAAAAPEQRASTPKTEPNNTTADNRRQVADAAAAGKPLGIKGSIVRGVQMPPDCTNAEPNLITYVEQHKDQVPDDQIAEFVCGWN